MVRLSKTLRKNQSSCQLMPNNIFPTFETKSDKEKNNFVNVVF